MKEFHISIEVEPMMGNIRKIKIVYLILNGDTYGGAEKHVVDLQNGVSDERFEKHLVYSIGNKMIMKINKNLQDNCVAVDRNILKIGKIISLIRELNPDILHLHAARGIFTGRMIALICRIIHKMNIKIVSTSHGLWLPSNKDNFLYKFLMHFKKDTDDITIAVSENSRKELVDIGYKSEKVYTVYNGVDFKEFDAYREIKKDIKQISFVGRLTEQKGISYLLESIKGVSKEYRFNIYGEGELEGFIREYIEKNNLMNVTLHGFSNNVGEVFNKTDLLIAPSINEGLPYTLIEAINCGVPIISTNVGGIPEIVHHMENGLLIEPRSSTAIVSAIKEIEKMDISALSRKSIEISKKFSLDTMIESIEDIYQKIIVTGAGNE